MEAYNLKNIFERHDGIMKIKELYKNGVSKYDIKKLTYTHVLERITQGYYKLYNEEISDIKLISMLIPGSVLCFDSALFYYGYSDKTPIEWHIAVNKDISKSKVKLDYLCAKPYFIEKKLLEISVEEVVIENVKVKVYSRGRLICDCLTYENKIDVELFNKAIQGYINDPKKNISKLMEFAELRNVKKKLYDKIGIWL